MKIRTLILLVVLVTAAVAVSSWRKTVASYIPPQPEPGTWKPVSTRP
ncbi:MAG: hypothetical protein OXH10_04815 [bacterium]|nr:hypothetical protein [bacterium]MCY3580080.1 hypothetical protein [bacterium]MCY3651732.1 hypothetical protein [bacterium]MDE0643544.1 hypothetical protein [bacterium]